VQEDFRRGVVVVVIFFVGGGDVVIRGGDIITDIDVIIDIEEIGVSERIKRPPSAGGWGNALESVSNPPHGESEIDTGESSGKYPHVAEGDAGGIFGGDEDGASWSPVPFEVGEIWGVDERDVGDGIGEGELEIAGVAVEDFERDVLSEDEGLWEGKGRVRGVVGGSIIGRVLIIGTVSEVVVGAEAGGRDVIRERCGNEVSAIGSGVYIGKGVSCGESGAGGEQSEGEEEADETFHGFYNIDVKDKGTK
jgi:hypothetical protein